MARLPRASRLGIMPAALPAAGPQVRPVADLAAADAAGTLAQRAQQLANSAFQMSGQLFAEEGARYGAANAPTAQQLMDANARGVEVELPGNSFSIRGRAARDAAIDVLAIDVQMAGTEAIAQAAAEATAAGLPPEEFRVRLDEISEGFRSAMTGVDAKAGMELNARMGVYANSQYVSYTKAWNERIERQRQSEAVLALDTVRQQFPAIVGAGNLMGEDGAITTPTDRFNMLIPGVTEMMVQRGFTPEAIRAEIDRMRKAFDAEVTNYWAGRASSPEYAGRGVALYNQFRQGRFDDPDMQDLYESMSPDQRVAAQNAIIAQIRDDEAIRTANERGADQARTQQIDDVTRRYNEARIAGDIDGMRGAAQEMNALDPDKASTMVTQVNKDPPVESDRDTQALIGDMIRRDDPAVRTTIREAYLDGRLSNDDYEKRMEEVDARADKTVSGVLKQIRLREGLSDDPANDTKEDREFRKAVINQVEADVMQYRADNPDATPADIRAFADTKFTEAKDRFVGRDLEKARDELESKVNRAPPGLRRIFDEGTDYGALTDQQIQGIIDSDRVSNAEKQWARQVLDLRERVRAMEGRQ